MRYIDRPEWVAFLARILSDPKDDTVRLVLADWLDELGEEEATLRAEFIRVQIAIARGEDKGRRFSMRKQERKCFKMNRYGLLESPFLDEPSRFLNRRFDGPRIEWDWHRGFVAEVRCRQAVWLDEENEVIHARRTEITPTGVVVSRNEFARREGIGRQIVNVHPVELVHLTDPPDVEYHRGGGELERWSASSMWLLPGFGTSALCFDSSVYFASLELAQQAWAEWVSDTLIWLVKQKRTSPIEYTSADFSPLFQPPTA